MHHLAPPSGGRTGYCFVVQPDRNGSEFHLKGLTVSTVEQDRQPLLVNKQIIRLNSTQIVRD